MESYQKIRTECGGKYDKTEFLAFKEKPCDEAGKKNSLIYAPLVLLLCGNEGISSSKKNVIETKSARLFHLISHVLCVLNCFNSKLCFLTLSLNTWEYVI